MTGVADSKWADDSVTASNPPTTKSQSHSPDPPAEKPILPEHTEKTTQISINLPNSPSSLGGPPARTRKSVEVSRLPSNRPSVPRPTHRGLLTSETDSFSFSKETSPFSYDNRVVFDLSLPQLAEPPDWDLLSWEDGSFNALFFVRCLQSGHDQMLLSNYLSLASYSSEDPDWTVVGVPMLFYIVQSQDIELLRLAVSKGAGVDCILSCNGVDLPLLVFAILHGYVHEVNVTSLLHVLLGAGINVSAQIPSWLLSSAVDRCNFGNPTVTQMRELTAHSGKAWYKHKEYSAKFRSALDIGLLHKLQKAAKLYVRPREFQIAQLRIAENLMEAPYALIGQALATDRLKRSLMSKFMENEVEPLILVFAGPSGHGKTELASKLGELLKLDLCKIDCASIGRAEDIFGISGQYINGDKSQPLNGYLISKTGKEGIVLLDEFEKTGADVHEGFLNAFDTGEYLDRTKADNIDCKRIIWVLTTNIFDKTISKFFEDNKLTLGNSDVPFVSQQECYEKLVKLLRQEAAAKWDEPMSGRISNFIPFLPFSKEEQSVGVHKLLKDFTRTARLPVNLQGERPNVFGNVVITAIDPSKLCSHVARETYMPALGMRSLKNGFRYTVRDAVFDQYLSIPNRIDDQGKVTKMILGTSGDKVIAKITEYDGRPYDRHVEE